MLGQEAVERGIGADALVLVGETVQRCRLVHVRLRADVERRLQVPGELMELGNRDRKHAHGDRDGCRMPVDGEHELRRVGPGGCRRRYADLHPQRLVGLFRLARVARPRQQRVRHERAAERDVVAEEQAYLEWPQRLPVERRCDPLSARHDDLRVLGLADRRVHRHLRATAGG